MNRKIIGIFIITLLITCFISSGANSDICLLNEKKLFNISSFDKTKNNIATASIKTYDSSKNEFIEKPIKEITKIEAEQIKKELLDIQNTSDSSDDRIRKQMDVLHKWDVLPDEITYEEFEKILENMNELKGFDNSILTLEPGVIIYGPAITSRLVLAGVLLPLHIPLWNFLKPWISITNYSNYDILNGTQIMKWVGVAPVLVYYCSAMTLINTFGLVLGPSTVFSPFMSIDILYAGFTLTINIWEDFHAVNILDWGVGVSLTGITTYVEQT